jgi:hypothetical protein
MIVFDADSIALRVSKPPIQFAMELREGSAQVPVRIRDYGKPIGVTDLKPIEVYFEAWTSGEEEGRGSIGVTRAVNPAPAFVVPIEPRNHVLSKAYVKNLSFGGRVLGRLPYS